MSWLSDGLRRLFGRDAYERAKRRLSRAVLSWLWDEAEPWVAELLVKNGLTHERAQALASEIIEQIAARVASE